MIVERRLIPSLTQPDTTYYPDTETRVNRPVIIYSVNPDSKKIKEKPNIPNGRRLIIGISDDRIDIAFASGESVNSTSHFTLEHFLRTVKEHQHVVHGLFTEDGRGNKTLIIYKASPRSAEKLVAAPQEVLDPESCFAEGVLSSIIKSLNLSKVQIRNVLMHRKSEDEEAQGILLWIDQGFAELHSNPARI